MTTPRTRVITILVVIAIAVLIFIEYRNNTADKPAPAPEVEQGSPIAVHKPYAVTVDLPDGRTTVCVFNNAGAMSCEWPEPVVPAEAPVQ